MYVFFNLYTVRNIFKYLKNKTRNRESNQTVPNTPMGSLRTYTYSIKLEF